jgi:hypothetical protein
MRFDLGMQVVGIDDYRFATGSDQFEDRNIQKRFALKGEKRFGGVMCVRLQPRSQPRCQDQCFHRAFLIMIV